jgi:hypothetical protein
MSKKLLFSVAAGAMALTAAACAAAASPLNVGTTITATSTDPITIPVRFGGGGGAHGGGFGGFHGGAFYAGSLGHSQFGSRSAFAGRMLARSRFDHGHFHGRDHRHRFFFAGYPYFYDDYYDGDYGDSCWWSRRYHRWLCPDY